MATEKRVKEPTAYDTLPADLTAQAWRNAFGLLQLRVKELEARIKALEAPKRHDVPRSSEPTSTPPQGE